MDNMDKHYEIQITKAESQYLGKSCFKTSGFKTIHTGVIREMRFTQGWLEANVYWLTRNGQKLQGHPHNWERIADLGFDSLPAFTSGAEYNRSYQPLHPISKGLPTSQDCHAQSTTHIDCDGDGIPQTRRHQSTASQNTKEHSITQTPRRADQSREANRYVNYRALLATIDNRTRDEWHILQLNEELKREGCSTITLPAFRMRTDKFQKSYNRASQVGGERLTQFLTTAFNGDWHGSLDNTSIWSQF